MPTITVTNAVAINNNILKSKCSLLCGFGFWCINIVWA
jgi:hypothetical protein